MCELTRERLARLLAGDLDSEQAELIARHLGEDCAACDALLDEHSLDEETLGLYLIALRQPEPHPASVERVWRNLQPRRRRWAWGVGGLSFAGAAAVLLLVLMPARPDPYTGVKGDIELPRAGLGLHWLSTDSAELHYSLERDAHITIVHTHAGATTVVASTRVLAAMDAPVPHDKGALAWSFAGESGVHLFLIVVSDAPWPEEWAPQLVRHEWLELPDGWTTAQIDDRDLGVAMIRVVVP